jgi:predicted DsbA family dithiol-disulfide isomerase
VRVERLMEEFEVEFDAWAYDLRPGIPPEGMPREHATAGRTYPPGYVDNLVQTARDSGIDMKRPALIPNTRKAHEATEFAKDAGKLLPFHRAVFSAYWEREENIGDIDVLCRVGEECGIDAGGLREALVDGRYALRVDEQIAWASAAGITGVPTFIFDERFALVGAQEYEVFRDVATRVIRSREQEVGRQEG